MQQKYKIIERLDSGGMAEVFKGKATSIEGFEKLVAIKRILPHLTKDKKFVAMFLDEARLSLYLNHANIVQVFDLGVADGVYFIVMEFVEGCNLKKIIENSVKKKFSFNVEQSVYVIIEVCKGLSYAHEKRDPNGSRLNIVHRDISPPNILISKEGEVKLTDFGLAKAASQMEVTDPGIVKGKFSYLSPEVAVGSPVDHRTDIFASGIILWELLAGRRLFYGKSDIHTIELIRKAEVPQLRPFNPSVPDELEVIVRKALAKDVEDRFQSAREMGDELSDFLFAKGLKVSSFDISSVVTKFLKAQKKRESGKEAGLINQLINEEILKFTSIGEENVDAASPLGSIPLSDEDISGSKPLPTDSFEDPRTWSKKLLEEEGKSINFDQFEEQINSKENVPLEKILNLSESNLRILPTTFFKKYWKHFLFAGMTLLLIVLIIILIFTIN